MTVMEHLTELRSRLIKIVLALAIAGVLAWALYSRILEFLIDPYCRTLPKGESCNLFITGPLEGFATRLKVSGYAAIALAMPVILWQLWKFVTPGLHSRERRLAIPFIVSTMLLFVFGGVIAMLTFPQALRFLQGVGGADLQEIYSPGKYLGLVSLMIVAFGAAFELPVLLVFAQLIGLVEPGQLARFRRYAAVIIVIVAAVITPSQDPVSLAAMAVPMYVFYEVSILLGRLARRRARRREREAASTVE